MKKSKLLLAVFSAALLFGFSGCMQQPEIEHIHTFSEEWTSDSENHWHAATCEHTEETDAKAAHTFDEGKITTAATEEAEGVKTFTCTVCGYAKTEKIEKLAHTHKFSEEWTSDAENHWHACPGCSEPKDKAAHTWNDGVVTKSPTITEDGTKIFTCTVCGKTRNENVNAALSGITVTAPSKTYYKKNEAFDSTGLAVTANYTYGLSKPLSDSDYTITGFDSANTGAKTITVSYTYSGVTKTAEITVTVYEQAEMTVEAFLNALGSTVETITSDAGVPGISKSEDGKTANVFGVKITGAFDNSLHFPSSLITADLKGLDTSNVTSMYCMFVSCENLISLDLRSFDTSSVTSMVCMFRGCKNLISLDLSSFDTSRVINMSEMFNSCSGLSSMDLSTFDTSCVTEMISMFSGCTGLTLLDLSSFTEGESTDTLGMFILCGNENPITVKYDSTRWPINKSDNDFYGGSKLTFQDVSASN